MGEVKEYPHGTFCWIDLGTTDLAGAKAFYGRLLGWLLEDQSDGYVLARRDGMDVAGMHVHTHEEGTGWASSINVGDVDGATARASELGAAVAMEPSDLPGTARISPIRDPAGAEVCLWQGRSTSRSAASRSSPTPPRAVFTIAAVPGGALRGVDGS